MTAAIHVTKHAAQRWVERINPRMTFAEAVAAISAHQRIVDVAAGFGCRTVLTDRARLILDGHSVVTVLPRRGPAYVQ